MIKKTKPKINDWRRQGQEKYLMGVKLIYHKYHISRLEWDHDHCEFCFAKISESESDLHEGYLQ